MERGGGGERVERLMPTIARKLEYGPPLALCRSECVCVSPFHPPTQANPP
jgi:hypothetical protein